ncbi:2615_t:CDS:2 [Ambispora gerdemannii]|uniref:Small ribosomal subunit protein uS10m n=1 Tax=Ambispora gerdemannii TaxID=144530 RepID=A0A9N9BJK2_9GLOM|nr:2615_t:CDS:2 [Ambispora gerdemannii]
MFVIRFSRYFPQNTVNIWKANNKSHGTRHSYSTRYFRDFGQKKLGETRDEPSILLEVVKKPQRNNQKDEEKLDPVLLEPERHQPTHNVVVCDLELRSYTTGPMDFYIDFIRRAAFALGIPCSGPAYLPKKIKRWAVPRGPFIHKKTQENFERITHRRNLRLRDANMTVIDRLLYYVAKNAPAGIGFKVKKWQWEEIGVGVRMFEEARGKERVLLKNVVQK